jgi:two-component system nitrate/nitrite response regulator NarL
MAAHGCGRQISFMNNSHVALKVLVVGDYSLLLAGVGTLLNNQADMKVLALTGERREALELAAHESPDLILLDLDLANEDVTNLLPELREAAKNARVLVLTSVTDPEAHRRVVQLGAMGVVLKHQTPEVLFKALRKVHAGEVWLERTSMGNVLHEMTRKKVPDPHDPEAPKIRSLTDREHQVIALIAEGLKNKQIAERLFISETTVTHHLSSIFSKLDVSDRLELVIYAFGHKIARLPK